MTGNMVTDSRKNLQFSYNFLNLLGEVKSGSTVKAKYTWLADGSKLRVRDAGTTGFDYLGSLTYTSSSSGLALETAQFAGGVIRSGNSQEINYFITDHLGSVRAIVNTAGTAVEQNDFYAFGAKHVRGTYPKNDNRLDYNGKEEQTTGDLKYLDYGARMYDNTIGRWFNTDPLAEKYYSYSPFNYCINNPLILIDPIGEDVYFIFYSLSDSRFFDAAMTRYREIKSNELYDPEKDHIYFLGLSDLGKLESYVNNSLTHARDMGYGKTVEAAFYGHGGADGPVGDTDTSGLYNLGAETGSTFDKRQLSKEGWERINWNFDPENSVMAFYGCRTASFAEKILDYSNAQYTAGQEFSTGPTYKLDE